MNGMKEAYTARELSPILGLTERAVLYLAEREGWQSRPRAGRGGGREWLVDSMPEDTRLAIAAKVALFTPVPVKAPAPVTLSLPSRFAGNGKTRAEAKAALFFLYRMFTKTAGLPARHDLDRYDFTRTEGIDSRKLRELRRAGMGGTGIQPASGRRFRNRKDLYCRRTCP